MLGTQNEKLLARIIAVGSGFTTIFIVSGSVTDPVNAPKLLSLGVAAAAAFGVVLASGVRRIFNDSKALWALTILFLLIGLFTVFNSQSPLSQGFFGSYGRNNGLLTYAFLSVLLLSGAALRKKESHHKIIVWLLISGIINIVYCLWVILFGDFIGWNNPYGNILGTLGNPNFIGSFLGIFLASYFAFAIKSDGPAWFRYSIFAVIPITAYEIYDSNAIQGRVVGLAGMAIVGFFLLRARVSNVYVWLYSLAVTVAGVFALLGALQVGPLTSLIYKTSVSLRGQYWLAGWNTGDRNPFLGAGMDSFGDWYRRSRDERALELPGINTVVNAAHNVPLDMFAFGGWPLFVTYVLIMSIGGIALLKVILRTRDYDPILSVLTAAWIGYQLQSIISINQIGLAIWGWVLTGAAVSYERVTRARELTPAPKAPNEKFQQRIGNSDNNFLRVIVVSSVSALVGLLMALPPFSADSKWRAAQLARTVESLEQTMQISFFNPANSMKYMSNIISLNQAQLPDLAHKYALEATKWNPESFELWRVLYFLEKSSEAERLEALENMKRLDPLNPDVSAPPK